MHIAYHTARPCGGDGVGASDRAGKWWRYLGSTSGGGSLGGINNDLILSELYGKNPRLKNSP